VSETVSTAPAARPVRRRLDLQDGPSPTGPQSGSSLAEPADFVTRHIGLAVADETAMLGAIGADSLDALLDEIVPEGIRRHDAMRLPPAVSEAAALAELEAELRAKSDEVDTVPEVAITPLELTPRNADTAVTRVALWRA